MPVVPLRSLLEESSQFRHLTTLATTPCFLPLVSASLFVGLGNAVGGSYLTLFVIDKAHLSPLALGVFLTVYSLSGMIRATWSIAWAVGPALGALMISLFDFQGVFLTATMCVVTATVIVAVARVDALRPTTETGLELKSRIGTIRQAGFAASSLTLFHMAMFMGSIALPIVATHELGGTKADVGLIFSLCAFLEVPVMFAFVLRPSVAGNRRWISVGFLAFILYFLTITWGPSVAILLAAQVLRAVGIGLIAYQGISYMQALMPNQAGSAATLFSNTANAGFLFASLTAGGWAQAFGYRSMFLACAVQSVLGLAMIQLQPRLLRCGK